MIAVLISILAGVGGGVVRAIITGKGIITLPSIHKVAGGSSHLNLGIIAPMAIGALAGYVAPYSLGVDGVVAALAGYAGTDLIENMVERTLHRRIR